MDINILTSKKILPIAVYCPPQPPADEIENRINDRSFALLKECGVNLVMGMNEEFSGPWEGYGFRAMDLCQKYGLTYFCRDAINDEFHAFEGAKRYKKAFCKFTEDERQDLKRRYIASMKRYMNHPACGGMLFTDEPGVKMLDGIRFAKEIFKEQYPDKIFYVNNFSYALNKPLLLYGIKLGIAENPETEILELPEYNHENRFICYEYYMERFLKIDPDILSFDLYPIFKLGGIKNAIHIGLYDLPAYYSLLSRKTGKPFWNYVQTGHWDAQQYHVGYPEAALQVNVSLALGARGIALYPGCFPNDNLKRTKPDGVTDIEGILDRYGEPTEQYFNYRRVIKNVQKAAPYLLDGKYLGAALYGKYLHILPDKGPSMHRDYNECAYQGEDLFGELSYRDGAILEIISDSQILTGTIENSDGGKTFYFVNNSTLSATRLSAVFDKEYDITAEVDGETFTACSNRYTLPCLLGAGEAVAVRLTTACK